MDKFIIIPPFSSEPYKEDKNNPLCPVRFKLTTLGKSQALAFAEWANQNISEKTIVYIGYGESNQSFTSAKQVYDTVCDLTEYAGIQKSPGLDEIDSRNTEDVFSSFIYRASDANTNIGIAISLGAHKVEKDSSMCDKILITCLKYDHSDSSGLANKVIDAPKKVLELAKEISKLCK